MRTVRYFANVDEFGDNTQFVEIIGKGGKGKTAYINKDGSIDTESESSFSLSLALSFVGKGWRHASRNEVREFIKSKRK